MNQNNERRKHTNEKTLTPNKGVHAFAEVYIIGWHM